MPVKLWGSVVVSSQGSHKAPPRTSTGQDSPACVLLKPEFKLNLAWAAQPHWEWQGKVCASPAPARKILFLAMASKCSSLSTFGMPVQVAIPVDLQQQGASRMETALLSPSPPLELGPERKK